MKDGLLAALSIVCAVSLAVGAVALLHTKSPCAVGKCPFELREKDAGGIYTYSVTSRISIVLDERTDPKDRFAVTCTPENVLGSISNIPSVVPPLYALRYEGTMPGTCTLHDDRFGATIRIVQQ